MLLEIRRDQAIALLAQRDLENLTLAERTESLAAMQWEAWEQAPGWADLALRVRMELKKPNIPIAQPGHQRYDAVLLMPLGDRYQLSGNEFLLTQLKQAGHPYREVTGEIGPRCACPCCGLCTLAERGNYGICRVCWWEDDGMDNAEAVYRSGVNGLSLIRARIHVLQTGLYDPRREDLLGQQMPSEKYRRARTFVLAEDGAAVQEPAVGWQGHLADEVMDD